MKFVDKALYDKECKKESSEMLFIDLLSNYLHANITNNLITQRDNIICIKSYVYSLNYSFMKLWLQYFKP